VTLQFHPSSTPPIHVRLGETTAQDLMVDLGPPLRTHYKEDERMTIHSTSQASERGMESECRSIWFGTWYRLRHHHADFYNYFQHGLDFLISGPSHIVKKIVIHSNVVSIPKFSSGWFPMPSKPGSPLFQRYKRCNWEIEGKPEDDEDGNQPLLSLPSCNYILSYSERHAAPKAIL
jgi:Uncharacterised protein family (UPF0183)